jgi:hypothetical protein
MGPGFAPSPSVLSDSTRHHTGIRKAKTENDLANRWHVKHKAPQSDAKHKAPRTVLSRRAVQSQRQAPPTHTHMHIKHHKTRQKGPLQGVGCFSCGRGRSERLRGGYRMPPPSPPPVPSPSASTHCAPHVHQPLNPQPSTLNPQPPIYITASAHYPLHVHHSVCSITQAYRNPDGSIAHARAIPRALATRKDRQDVDIPWVLVVVLGGDALPLGGLGPNHVLVGEGPTPHSVGAKARTQRYDEYDGIDLQQTSHWSIAGPMPTASQHRQLHTAHCTSPPRVSMYAALSPTAFLALSSSAMSQLRIPSHQADGKNANIQLSSDI